MERYGKLLSAALLIAFLAGFSQFSSPVSAYSNVGLTLSSERIQKCPGDAETLILTVTNNDDIAHTYFLSLGMPGGWKIPDNGFIPYCADCPDSQGLTLASGESREVGFWINPPAVAPATYVVTVTAKSGSDQASKSIETVVLRCHDVAVEVPPSIDTCADTKFQYSFDVANNGKSDEEFLIVASGSWGFGGTELHRENIKIAAGKKSTISFDTQAPATGGAITVTATSKTSYASSQGSTKLNVEKCYGFQATILPASATTCLGTPVNFTLSIKNTGTMADVYIISAPDWVYASQANVSISPGSTKSIYLIANPPTKGRTQFGILQTSKGSPDAKNNATVTLDVSDCRRVEISAPASLEVCKGEPATLNLTVKNTGSSRDTYDLTSSLGSLNPAKVTLEAGESKPIVLKIDAAKLDSGQKQVDVTAKSSGATGKYSIQLSVNSCYLAEFGVSPQASTICKGDKINFVLAIKNTGGSDENFTFGLQGQELGNVNLASGELKLFTAPIGITLPAGNASMKFTLRSKHVSMDAYSNVTMLPQASCYAVEITSDGPLSKVDPGKGIAISANVRNKGIKPVSVDLGLVAPSWVHLSQGNATLAPGEEATVYLYASPGYDVVKNTYDAVMKASSESSGIQNFTFRIGVGVMPQAGNGSENSSTSTIPTGAFISLKGNSGKVILLAVIVLIILVILAVKFVLFVK
jgi:uncharacterized membrane protein